jgi:hypothetical protein
VPKVALPAISELLAQWSAGDREAFQALIPLTCDLLGLVS